MFLVKVSLPFLNFTSFIKVPIEIYENIYFNNGAITQLPPEYFHASLILIKYFKLLNTLKELI